MSAHPFLSPEWIAAARAIRDEFAGRAGPTQTEVKANVTITDAPFADSTILGHIDTTGGALSLDENHLDDSDFAIEIPYSVARQLFVERDPAAIVPVLIGGQVKLTGDSSKILLLAGMATPSDASSANSGLAAELMRRVDAITE